MDNTKVPPSLLCRERRSLEEFVDNSSLNETLVDNMSNIYYLQKNFKEFALECMNTAYYICTLMLREKHPDWCFTTYCDLAYCKQAESKINQSVTLSLVCVYINGLSEEQRKKLQKLKKLLDDFMNSITHFIEMGNPFLSDYTYADVLNHIKSGLQYYSIDDNEFAFRVIDKETVRDVMSVRDFNWGVFVDYFRESRVRELVDYYGRTGDEKHNVVDILRQAANGFYTKGFNDKPEQVNKMLDTIDDEINNSYKSEHEKKNAGADNVNVESCTGSANYLARIKELETKLENLEKDFQQAKDIIEELRLPVEELTAEQKVRMAFTLQLLKAAGLTDEKLKKRGNGAKVATIISFLTDITSNNQRGNEAQICQTFLSDKAKYYPRTKNMDTLIRLNSLCVELGINCSLSLESQSNK